MLVQDTLTGSVHQVPDDTMYGYAGVADDGAMYDGYGNPVGFPPLIPILTSLAPAVLPPLFKAFTSGFKGPDDEYAYADGWVGDDDPYGDVAQGEMLYDGFGNPVGFAPLLSIAKSVLPGVAKMASRMIPGIARTASGLIRSAPGLISRAGSLVRSMVPPGIPRPPFPIPRLPMPGIPRPPFPVHRFPLRRPPGWMRAPVPYTGPQPRRVYMRCATWPGPPGLVPVAPGPVPGAPARPVRRRRRRRR